MVSKLFNLSIVYQIWQAVLIISFKVLDIQDEEEMQRKIKRQKININGKQNTVASSSSYSLKFMNHITIINDFYRWRRNI